MTVQLAWQVLARRASLVVVLLLLASVGTASAECAWVLWRVDHEARPARVALDAFETKKECERERQQLAEKAAEAFNRGGPLVGVLCLPDTIDPRGPKGK